MQSRSAIALRLTDTAVTEWKQRTWLQKCRMPGNFTPTWQPVRKAPLPKGDAMPRRRPTGQTGNTSCLVMVWCFAERPGDDSRKLRTASFAALAKEISDNSRRRAHVGWSLWTWGSDTVGEARHDDVMMNGRTTNMTNSLAFMPPVPAPLTKPCHWSGLQ